MAIKFAVLRGHHGVPVCLKKAGAKIPRNVGGHVEVLVTNAGSGRTRVTVNGSELAGYPAEWPNDLAGDTAVVTIEQLVDDVVISTVTTAVTLLEALPAPNSAT